MVENVLVAWVSEMWHQALFSSDPYKGLYPRGEEWLLADLCSLKESALLREGNLIVIILLVGPILVLSTSVSTSLYFSVGKIGKPEKTAKESWERQV